MELGIQILVTSPDDITPCLESALEISSHIIVGDLTSHAIIPCKKLGIKRVELKELDYSSCRNALEKYLDTELRLYLNQNEIIKFNNSIDSVSRLYIVQNNTLSKEVRVYKKGTKFINPCFETLEVDDAPLLDNFIISNPKKDKNIQPILEKWKKKIPHKPEIDYYFSIFYLIEGNYNKFQSYAESFLFKSQKVDVSTIMCNYYLGHVRKYLKSYDKAILNVASCLMQNPLMAEFWCLLGDCFFCRKEFAHASEFYENAIILGEKRLRDDPFPIELDKYKEYPKSRILTNL